MPISEWMSLAALVLSALAVLGVAVLLLLRHRQAIADRALETHVMALVSGDERLERTLRDELARGREEAANGSRGTREELVQQFRGLQDAVVKTLADTQAAQHLQFGQFSERLREGIVSIDRRIDAMSLRQAQAMTDIRQADAISKQQLQAAIASQLATLLATSTESDRALREEVQTNLKRLGDAIAATIDRLGLGQKERLEQVSKELVTLTQRHEQAQALLRSAVEQRLDQLRSDNAEKLEKIRTTVDEQLQGTLEKRLGESFKLVSDRLEQVHKGLGEMQTLASGVGDLKRVLTNVKTRGTWGEVQLGGLLEQMLTPDQYLKDAQTRPGSLERVEYAIRLPGKGAGDGEVLLPVDAKFPQEDYDRLVQAADRADTDAVEAASKQLETRIRASAKEIRDKYINPPATTDFAILFLPTEGLYAEVLRRPGTVEHIQREYRVTLAGPTTLSATLNALQMGFRTLAIQKRSSEVWQVLEAVKTEFGKYGQVLDKVQKKLQEASKSIDDVATRRRAIDRRLRAVGDMSEGDATALLGLVTPSEAAVGDVEVSDDDASEPD